MLEKVWHFEMVGHTELTVSKQREVKTGSRFAFSFALGLGSRAWN